MQRMVQIFLRKESRWGEETKTVSNVLSSTMQSKSRMPSSSITTVDDILVDGDDNSGWTEKQSGQSTAQPTKTTLRIAPGFDQYRHQGEHANKEQLQYQHYERDPLSSTLTHPFLG